MYHRVAHDSFDPWGLAVSPALFDEQLRWLAANRTVLSLAEFAMRHRRGTLPASAVALTFDDGYDCVAETAAPMLEQARLPATIFIPAELIERGRAFWWDELQDIVLGHGGGELVLLGATISLGPTSAKDRSWRPGAPPKTPRQSAFQKIWAALREKRPKELDEAMENLRGQARICNPIDVPRPMTPEKARKLASANIAFGSHALTHPWLTSLGHPEKEREIRASIEACETVTGTRPTTFAYPYGNRDAESERIVEAAGFDCACGTTPTAVNAASQLFSLPRIQIGNWTARQLARAVAAA
jgi:peptidoglycan/xylan/chitin deacetylase (PgdA/CDA1 family)